MQNSAGTTVTAEFCSASSADAVRRGSASANEVRALHPARGSAP